MRNLFALRNRVVATLVATLLACAGQPDATEPEAVGTQEAPALSTRVVGYFPTWQGDVNAIQYDKLTHINYSFALPTAQGGISAVGSTDARLQVARQTATPRASR